jgi:putative ATPase
MDDLFSSEEVVSHPGQQPLAARFRPRSLEDYVGQEHLLGPGKPLRRLIEADRLTSLILFGPPGVGKTSLAEIIALSTRCQFERMNAVESGVHEVRAALSRAGQRLKASGRQTLLFIDEIHRFSKSQQDALLPDVEKGTVRLIGATTHNPSFYINGPLVSRSQIFQLEPLQESDLRKLIQRVLMDTTLGLGAWKVRLEPEAEHHLIATSEGDARRVLNGLEIAALTTPANAEGEVVVTAGVMAECIQRKVVLYDRNEDEHYDTISAFIKSVRGSDPDSALYWLAKMVEAGEDPRFIARRLVILAAEDIGLADPRGIMVAVAAHQAVEFIGMPEGRIPLAEATLYLATAPKSNSSILAIDEALGAVKKESTVAVPRMLRDAHYAGAKQLGHGAGYEYSHDAPGGFSGQTFGVQPGLFYHPTDRGYEKQVAERLAQWEKLRQAGSPPSSP